MSKVPAVTEADARKFYDENKARIEGEFEQTKEQIIQYLGEVKSARRPSRSPSGCAPPREFRRSSRRPRRPSSRSPPTTSPRRATRRPPVTLVEFTDFQCPSCAQTHPALERLVAEYGDRVRLVVARLPALAARDAQKAAEAAEAAREQGKYWEYAAILFQTQSAFSPTS